MRRGEKQPALSEAKGSNVRTFKRSNVTYGTQNSPENDVPPRSLT